MTRVECLSAATSTTVWNSLSCITSDVSAVMREAQASCCAVWNSPSAVITRARRSRSTSACRDIEVQCHGGQRGMRFRRAGIGGMLPTG